MASNSNDRIRFRYGMCLNDGCSKAKAKEVQQIPARKEFVCAECGKALRECPPPPKGGNTKLIIAIVAIIAVLAGGAVLWYMTSEKPTQTTTHAGEGGGKSDTTIVADTLTQKPQTPVKDDGKKKAPVVNQVVTKDFGYAVYKGRMKNGKMHDDNGVLTFKEAHIIEPRDIKQRTAQPGERVTGIFEDGHLVTGTWHKNDGNKESIIP